MTWVTAQRATAIAFVTSMFLSAMDIAIINVALPTLSRVFHASNVSVQWAVIAYALSLAIWIPASGRIADRIGTKRAFLIALAVFTLASALCGLARNLQCCGGLIRPRSGPGLAA
jgi:MFS family permease